MTRIINFCHCIIAKQIVRKTACYTWREGFLPLGTDYSQLFSSRARTGIWHPRATRCLSSLFTSFLSRLTLNYQNSRRCDSSDRESHYPITRETRTCTHRTIALSPSDMRFSTVFLLPFLVLTFCGIILVKAWLRHFGFDFHLQDHFVLKIRAW